MPKEITPQLLALPEKDGFAHLIKDKKGTLGELEKQLKETEEKDKKVYKEIVISYLKELENYFDFAEFNYQII